jgi:cytochrome c oxidase assembly protein subunit 15
MVFAMTRTMPSSIPADPSDEAGAVAIAPPPSMRFAARRCGPFARSLAVGTGSAVAMWVIAYLSMMSPGLLVGEVLFVLTLGCALAGGLIAGRNVVGNESGWAAGVTASLVTATLNMLLIGSLAGGASAREKMTQFMLWMIGNYAVTLVLGALGGAIGSAKVDRHAPPRNWFSLFTRVVAVTVFLLLITGGLVTGLEAGLAVPDWPNSFGHNMLLYPLSEMVGGIYYEHAHRLYGMLVGVTAITLAVSMFFFDERKWSRAVVVMYLLLVISQGVLGGFGRVLQREVWYAVVHGIFGQIVFASACAIAAFSSRTWMDARQASARPSAQTDRTWSLVLLIAMLLQLTLGAIYRHTLHVHVVYTHIFLAVFVAGFATFVGGRAMSKYADLPVLPRVGKAAMHTVGLQIALGIVALIAVLSRPAATPATADQATPVAEIPLWEIIFTTAHQATGALLLALATLLMLWTRRLLNRANATA